MKPSIKIFLVLSLCYIAAEVSAQVPSGGGLIVNEINQGTAGGTKEFFELLVLGDPANPCSPVDLSGWVFDDNNGDFEACGIGVGIQAGHYRFTSCYSAVAPGSLLVIYNSADPYTGMPADDPTDADGDGIYIIPSNSSCLEVNYSIPNSTTPNCTYSGSYISPTTSWAAGMANSGDAAQTRKPDFSFFHGFSYGNVNTTYPVWPSGASSGSSFNKGSGNLALDCGDFWNSSNYFTITAGAGTPGAANSTANGYFIGEVLNCDVVYTNLSDVINCDLVLPITLTSFSAAVLTNTVQLSWETANETDNKEFVIERCNTSFTFYPIATIAGSGNANTNMQYVFTDDAPLNGINYYRLKQVDINGQFSYSKIAFVFMSNENVLHLFPNPASDILTISATTVDDILLITDMQGRIMLQGNFATEINISSLTAGMYQVKLISRQNVSSASFIKQ